MNDNDNDNNVISILFKNFEKDFRHTEPYIAEDGIYMPEREYEYEGMPTTYRMVMSKEMFQEAFREYIIKEGLLDVQSKKHKDK